MGMYTELVLNVSLRDDTPNNVLDLLRFMTGNAGINVPPVTEHALFSTARWAYMLQGCSFYFIPYAASKLVERENSTSRHLTVRCDFKNYGDEVELFLDWLASYVDGPGFSGYTRYEEDEAPTLIWFREGVFALQPVSAPAKGKTA